MVQKINQLLNQGCLNKRGLGHAVLWTLCTISDFMWNLIATVVIWIMTIENNSLSSNKNYCEEW